MSVVGNLTVILVVYKSKQLRHSQYVYNCSIAVSDIIWGFTISIYFLIFFVELLNFDPCYLTDMNIFLNKVEITKEKNNITVYKYQLDYVRLYLKFFEKLMDKYFSVVLRFITQITLSVSFISLLFASIDRYVV